MKKYTVYLKEDFSEELKKGKNGYFYSKMTEPSNHYEGIKEMVLFFKDHCPYNEKNVGTILELRHTEFNIDIKDFLDCKIKLFDLEKIGIFENDIELEEDKEAIPMYVNGVLQIRKHTTLENLVDFFIVKIDDFINKNKKTYKLTKKNYDEVYHSDFEIGDSMYTDEFCDELLKFIEEINERLHIINLHYCFEEHYFTY